jgi:hypothetical protein
MTGQRDRNGRRHPSRQRASERHTRPPSPSQPSAWRQRVAALLPTQRLRAIVPVRRGRRPGLLRWGAVVLLVAVLFGGGGAVLYKLDHAAEDAASQFCTDAQAGHYATAYDLLGTAYQTQLPHARFERIGAALDSAEGRITSCMATGYDYTLGSDQATITAHITRASGYSFSGQMRMANESGWKVVALDPRLTGASLGALDVVLRFCDALRANDSAALLALSGADASTMLGNAQQLATTVNTWQQVDGAVTGCTLAGTGGAGASASRAQVTLSVTRARRGMAVAVLGLTDQTSGWRVTSIANNLLGSDLGPLAVGQRFCAALGAANYAGAYALFSPNYTAQVSLGQFTAAFSALGGTWACAPRLTTYAAASTSASYEVVLTLSGTGQPLTLTVTLHFAFVDGAWTLQNVEPQGQ